MSDPNWTKIPAAEGCEDWHTSEDWILIDAFWQDADHYWRDVAFWTDNIINWVTV